MQTNPWLPRFAKLLVGATFCLIFLGGMVTSKNAGLSVPDWPTSYGYSMFTFPINQWVGGIFFEHTHRLLATCVGLITAVLVAWIWRNRWAVPAGLGISAIATAAVAISLPHFPALSGPENSLTRGLIIMHVTIWSFAAAFGMLLLITEQNRRPEEKRWLQWLGFLAFLLVCVQGTLGGLRVTEQSTVLAMIHACTAQAFLCITVVMAAALSPQWDADLLPLRGSRRGLPAVKTLAWVLVGAIYCQLILGAVMRHWQAGLSIPTFPLAFGRLIPPLINERVAINLAHRVGALVVTLIMLALVTTIFTFAQRHARLKSVAIGLIGAVMVQVALGGLVIISAREPLITSLHVVNGAGVLVLALLLAMRATKLKAQLHVQSRGWRPAPYHEITA